jgi:hypothetical protein
MRLKQHVFLMNALNLINSTEQSSSWEANSRWASQEIPRCLWNQSFITVFTRDCHCPYTEPDVSSPHNSTHFPKNHSNISTHLRQGLASGLFPSDFTAKILYAFLISPMRATFSVSLFLLGFIALKAIKILVTLKRPDYLSVHEWFLYPYCCFNILDSM